LYLHLLMVLTQIVMKIQAFQRQEAVIDA
jgi:hypothetical protein